MVLLQNISRVIQFLQQHIDWTAVKRELINRACLHRRPWRRRERTDEHEQSRFTPETMKTERENGWARAEQVYTGDHEDGERELTSTSRAGLQPETMKTERENWRARAEQVYTGDHEDGERELTSTSRAGLHRRPWRRRERTDEHEQSRFTPETMKTERENWRARAEQVYTGDHEDGERETDEHEQSRFTPETMKTERENWRARAEHVTPETMKTERENGWARAEHVYTGDHEDGERTDEHEQSRFTPETMKTERENWRARAEHVYTGDHEDGERELTSTSRACLHRRPWRRRERTDEHEQSRFTPETMKTERENWRARAEHVYTGDHEDGERERMSTSRAGLHRRPWRRRERTDEHEQSMFTPETMKTERENGWARAEQVYTGDHEDGERTDEHEQSMFTPETMKTERENWRARAEQVYTGDHEDGERERMSTSRAGLHRRPWRRRERTDEHEQSMFTPETMKTERENGWARAEHVYTGDHEDGERTDEHEQSMFTPETMKTERENWRARAEQVYTGDHEDGERERMSTSRACLHRRPWRRRERTDEHEQSMFTPETMKTERELMSTSRACLHRRPWRQRERTDEHEQSRFTPETMKTERENGWARAEQVYTGDHEDGERELTSTSRAGLHRRPWRRRERTDEHEQSMFTPETMKTERENWWARAEHVYTGDHEDGERERMSTSRAGLHRRPWRRRERTDEHEQSRFTPETMKTERENWRARAEQVYTGDHEDGERELTSTSRAGLHRRPWRRRERTDEHEQSMFTPETMKTERERTDEHEQSMFTPETMKTERENWRARAEHVYTGDHEDGERELTSTSRAGLHRRPWRRRERTDEHEQSMFTPETMKTERENGWARAEQVYTGDHEDGERERMSTSRAGLHRRPWRRRERTDEHEQSRFTPETMKTERENGWARAEQVYTGDHEDGERERMSTSRAGLHRRPKWICVSRFTKPICFCFKFRNYII